MFAEILKEIQRTAKEAPRWYFAPLVGAVRGIRAEYARLAQEAARAPNHAHGVVPVSERISRIKDD